VVKPRVGTSGSHRPVASPFEMLRRFPEQNRGTRVRERTDYKLVLSSCFTLRPRRTRQCPQHEKEDSTIRVQHATISHATITSNRSNAGERDSRSRRRHFSPRAHDAQRSVSARRRDDERFLTIESVFHPYKILACAGSILASRDGDLRQPTRDVTHPRGLSTLDASKPEECATHKDSLMPIFRSRNNAETPS
jgi:hypothetical protein